MTPSGSRRPRLAIIVSHPIQYSVPLYRRLAQRTDVEMKVFFTWHAGEKPVHDRGFNVPIAWDIPLTQGYAYEAVHNVSTAPGTHHFFGLKNPSLTRQVMDWRSDAVHITGWAWYSHLQALHRFHKLGVPILFRGDSHLLDTGGFGLRERLKQAVLTRVYSWPRAFLYVGSANRRYYERFKVPEDRLYPCPHSVDVSRFAEPDGDFERKAQEWRRELGIEEGTPVVLFAGKFEPKKQPLALMDATLALENEKVVTVLVGGGELEETMKQKAALAPNRFRVLPFQNQTRMPVVYRLGDLFVLPSAYRETWGLAVNEALASGRPVLVSDRVGCADDVVDPSCGRVFRVQEAGALGLALRTMLGDIPRLREMRPAARRKSLSFDIGETEIALMACLKDILGK